MIRAKRLGLVFALGLFFCVGSASANERVVDYVMKSIGCSRSQAVLVEKGLNEFIERFEVRLRFLATSDAPINVKEDRAKEILREFFANRKSVVWVSSLTRPERTYSYYADEYLNHLAHLGDKYTRVTFYFDATYLSLTKIGPDPDRPGAYEASVSIRQIFIGRHPEYVYADETTKQLWVQFRFEGQRLRFTIHTVRVSDTVPRPEMTLKVR